MSGEEALALRSELARAGAARLSGPQPGLSDFESVRVTFFWGPRGSEWPLLASHFSYPQPAIAPEVIAIDAILQRFVSETFSSPVRL